MNTKITLILRDVSDAIFTHVIHFNKLRGCKTTSNITLVFISILKQFYFCERYRMSVSCKASFTRTVNVSGTVLTDTLMDKQECIPVGCVPSAHWPYPMVSAMACMPPHHAQPPLATHAPCHSHPSVTHAPPPRMPSGFTCPFAMHTPATHTPCHACPPMDRHTRVKT